MRFHKFVIIFTFIWFSGAIFAFLALSYQAVTQGSSAFLGMIVGGLMLIFGGMIVSKSFWFDANKAKQHLLELTKGIEIPLA